MIELKTDPTRRELRQFALLWFPAFCAVIAILLWRKGGYPTAGIAVATAGLSISAVGFFVPAFMRIVFVGLTVLTYPIGWVVSHVLVTATFFFALTPIGILMRALGHDPLHRTLDRDTESYWIERERDTPTSRYFRQF